MYGYNSLFFLASLSVRDETDPLDRCDSASYPFMAISPPVAGPGNRRSTIDMRTLIQDGAIAFTTIASLPESDKYVSGSPRSTALKTFCAATSGSCERMG